MKRVLAYGGLWALLVAGAGAQVDWKELPAPTRGIRLGEVDCSLFADLMYFYDSNVDFVSDRQTGDSGLQAKVGADFSYGNGEHNLHGRGWFMAERFLNEDRVDRNQWGVELGYSFESPNGTALRLDEIYEQVFQSDLQTGRWQDRREFRVNGSLGRRMSEKTSFSLAAGVSDITYAESGLYDWREYSASLDLGRRLSAKSDIIFNVGVTEQTSESVSDGSTGYSLSGGFSSRPTSKVTYRATAGLESYSSGVDGQSSMGVTYNLAMDWKVSAKWTATVSGTGQYQPGEDVARNYAQVYTLGTGITYHPTRRLSATMQTLYRRDDFAEPVRLGTAGATIYIPVTGPGGRSWLIPVPLGGWRAEDRTDNQVTVRGDVSFKLTKYATVSAGGEYSVRTSTVGDQYEYDRYRLQTGLNLRY